MPKKMAKMSWTELIHKSCAFLGYTVTRKTFEYLRLALGIVDGTYWAAMKNWNLMENYERSAEVKRIVNRFKFDERRGSASLADFITVHEEFTDPVYVLKDTVSLYCISHEAAVFVELPEGLEPWKSSTGPFFKVNQFQHAVKIIIMPLGSFNVVSDFLEKPLGKMVFIQTMAQSEAELMLNMFENTGQCVVFSEPEAMTAVTRFFQSSPWDQERVEEVSMNVIKMLCKLTKAQTNVQAYVVQLSEYSISSAPYLKQVCPESSHLLIYHDCLKNMESQLQPFIAKPLVALSLFLDKLSRFLTRKAVRTLGFPTGDMSDTLPNNFSFSVFVWSVVMKRYLQLREDGFPMVGVLYDDMVSDPDFAIRAVFRHCSLPEEWATKALKVIDKDTQQNLKIEAEYSLKDRQGSGGQGMGQPCVLPGTISHRKD